MSEQQGPNTYRGFVLVRNAADPHKPTVLVGYVKGAKYGDAWRAGRAIANGTKDAGTMYADQECKKALAIPAGAVFVACDDLRVRNVKLDKKALEAIINDPKASDADKVAALQGLMAAKAPAAATA